jgi:hypothetical protein
MHYMCDTYIHMRYICNTQATYLYTHAHALRVTHTHKDELYM